MMFRVILFISKQIGEELNLPMQALVNITDTPSTFTICDSLYIIILVHTSSSALNTWKLHWKYMKDNVVITYIGHRNKTEMYAAHHMVSTSIAQTHSFFPGIIYQIN